MHIQKTSTHWSLGDIIMITPPSNDLSVRRTIARVLICNYKSNKYTINQYQLMFVSYLE